MDREDPRIAARVLGSLCPDVDAQRCFARYALQTVNTARAITESSWEITLLPSGIRLNVGQIAVLELWAGVAVFYCCAPVAIEPPGGIRPQPDWEGYRAVKAETERWHVELQALPRVPPPLIEKHLELVRLAALGRKVSLFRAAHSPGLFTYLEELAGRAAPVGEEPLTGEVAPGTYPEGDVHTVTANVYERNEAARKRCIEHYGPTCAVCGFNFRVVCGAVAAGFIEVHHLKTLSEIGEAYDVDPIADLRPVCPNCHAVIHLGGQTRSIQEVEQFLEAARRTEPLERRTDR